MMVTAPSRRANDRNEQPRRGRASTPRRHPTPRRTVTPTRPVVIRVDAPPAPAPATPTHPWLSPEQNWEEDPWTRAEREHAEQQEARAAGKAPPPPAPSSTPEPTPPVTPSINPPRQHSQHRVEETPINRAFETLRQAAGSTIHSIPASMPAPSSDSGPYDLTQVATRADTNPMTQSWNLISGFPATPSPPRVPDTILGAWFERPPIQFTRQLPPTHIQGMPSLLRADSSFTSLLENHYPVSMGTWGTIIHGNMTPQVPGHQHFESLQLIPMASETSTADASLLKFWWHQHLLIARNVAQERFANSSAGPTIISDHLQAFLLTAINLMRLARPVGPPFELRQPEGPALASLAETLLETLQGTMTMDMKMGIATGHIGELVLEGDHNNSRLVFYRTQTWTGPPRQRSMSSTQRSHDDEVEVVLKTSSVLRDRTQNPRIDMRHKQVQSPMASSSTADVLDEATTTLIVGIKNMKESKTPQQIEDYIHKLQSLGRHMQLQQFRTWLKDQCGLPIAVRPSNLNTKEYMSKEQIEQWIEDWTTQNAQGNEQRVLKNFLLMDFAVQPNQKMQPCSNCEQPFMLFMLLPMKQHNMNMYDPDEHKLFCYNCCTEVGQMLHPGRYVPPEQQAIERQKALNQNPPGLTMAECELRALSGDRGYIPPTWYLATPPGAAVPPDHAIIIHRWDTETSQWIKLPLTKAGEDHEASQYSPHEWQLLVKLVWQTRKAQAQQGLQTHRSTTYKSLRDALIETQPNLSKRKAKMALLDHQEFLATQAGTDLWTLEPQQLQRLVKAFHDWEKVNFTQMVTGHNNGLLDYLEHKDSIAHLQDFLDVVVPNLHQHCICRSTDCSFVIKASHWINSATPDKQGKYLCPRCRTEYRPWAASAVNNPNKKFCPAAQCLVTKVTSATPPDSDGWAQQLTYHTTSTDTFYLYLMKFPTTNDQKLLNDCKLAVDQVATALSQSPDPQAALLEYINTVLTHAQMLPYFQQHVVSQDILNQVQQANAMRQWKWEHLPKSMDPNTRVTIYHYQGCRYEWDPEHTKVLEHADVHQLIALTFCKVYLTRFLQLSFKAPRT
eukprot:symbB.v1.2.021448.t1/scaffold1853.1/size98709/4